MDLEINNNKNINNIDNFSNELRKHLEKTVTTFSIDRFEGNFAVCENLNTGEFVNIPKEELPGNCEEGSILKYENNKFILDVEETNAKREEIKNLVDNLFKRKK